MNSPPKRQSDLLLARCPVALQEPLGHAVRREILRTLNRSSVPLTPADINKAAGADRALSEVSYHCLGLSKSGILRIVATGGSTSHGRAFSSCLIDSVPVADFLAFTARDDHASFKGRPSASRTLGRPHA